MHPASSIRGLSRPRACRLVAKAPCGTLTVWADHEGITVHWPSGTFKGATLLDDGLTYGIMPLLIDDIISVLLL